LLRELDLQHIPFWCTSGEKLEVSWNENDKENYENLGIQSDATGALISGIFGKCWSKLILREVA